MREALRERFTVTSSSLGSYFGVGFNDPLTQLKIDMGELPNDFDEDAEKRMRLGELLEDASLNVLEYMLDVVITNRNTEVLTVLDGKLRVKLDGECIYEGVPTIVENKVSNAESYVFTENKGYILQCQAYMLAKGYDQCILGGLYKGKPVWRLIKRDDNIIGAIKEMVEAVYGILNGIVDEEEFPWHLVELFNKSYVPKTLDTFDAEDDGELLEAIAEAQEQVNYWKWVVDDKKDVLKNKYDNLKSEFNGYKIAVTTFERGGTLNTSALLQDHPDVDIEKYKGTPTLVKNVRVTKTKGAN